MSIGGGASGLGLGNLQAVGEELAVGGGYKSLAAASLGFGVGGSQDEGNR
jgi:hypothetical protein